MSALLARWRRIAVVGLLAGGVVAGTALAAVPAVPAEAATVKNLVGNGSAESLSRGLPKSWAKAGSGTNTRIQTSRSGGAQSGKRYVRTKITKYRSGAAWWLTPVASVSGGSSYTYTEYYRSGNPTVLNAYFTVGGKVVGQKVTALRPAGRWKAARVTVKAPAGATKVRFGHVLSAVGYVDVDNVSLVAAKASAPGSPATTPGTTPPVTAASSKGIVTLSFDDGWANQLTNAAPIMQAAGGMPGTFYLFSSALGAGEYLTVAQARQLQSAGHELGSHTVNHVNLVTNADAATVTRELSESKKTLEGYFGAGKITSFAYPYGAGDARVQTEAAKYYSSARSTNPGLNKPGQYNRYSLTIGYVLNSTPVSTVQGWIDEAKANNTWLILCYHRIANDQPSDPYTLSVSSFQSQVSAIRASGVRVMTVSQGLAATGG